MGGDPGVDPGRSLAAINDGAADRGPGLVNSADGTAENLEREGGFVERSEEGAKLEFLLYVG